MTSTIRLIKLCLIDTKFVVDAFSYGKIIDCEGYFLTHFHSDHYHGLTHAWNHGPIYCSRITANLVSNRFNVNDRLIHVLPMDQPTFITPTIKVTLIDANHCPGSALFIFDIQLDGGTWIRHLHTGDFRATPSMCLHPHLRQPENPTIDHLYLDTTYLDAKYGFPAQEESIQAACRLVEEHIPPHTMSQKNNSQDILVVVGSYTIGKEKVFLGKLGKLKSIVSGIPIDSFPSFL
jgi:DNA cross-link repair 1A protein